MSKTRIALAAAAAILAPMLAQAQTDPKAGLRSAISAAVTPLLGESSAAIVEKLSAVKPEGFISRNFDLAKAKNALFPRMATNDAQDCRTARTPMGEDDTGMCAVEYGNRDSEGAAYRVLAFSKNIGIGEVQFARRDAYTGKPPAPVTLEDAKAYSLAMSFFDMIGVPKSEIPAVPKGAPLPVRSMVVGSADEQGGSRTAIVMYKVVFVPRAFVVPGGLGTGPNGQELKHALAPGGATAAIAADGSVRFGHVEGWSDAQFDWSGKPRGTAELVNAITDDLWGEGARKVGTLSVLIAFRKAIPNPEDPRPPACPVCGVLRPALKVVIASADRDRPPSGGSWVAPGLVRYYDLLGGQTESDRTAPR